MNIKEYFFNIKKEINKLNDYVSNPFNYRNIKNPYSSLKTKTYVWVDDDKKNFFK